MSVPATFPVEVDGIGTFVFRKRTMRDQYKIEAEASRMMGGPCDDEPLRLGAICYSALTVLTVEPPPGWSIEDFDPLDPDTTQKIFAVHRRLREVEAGFREGNSGNGSGSGAAPI